MTSGWICLIASRQLSSRQILDVAERNRSHSVVPVGALHPQAIQTVPLLFQRQHAVGVVRQFADQKYFQSIVGRQGIGPLAHVSIMFYLIDRMAD